jgi:hypothetical protein
MSDDDQAWMDAMAGRRAAGLDPRSEQEALALRKVALEKAAAQALDASAVQAGEQRLLARLAREGLLGRRERAAAAPWRLAFAAAAALVLGVGLMIQYSGLLTTGEATYDEPPGYRGAPERRSVRAPDARAYAEALQREIAAGGGGARVYQRGQVYYVELSLAPGSPEPVRQALRKRNIADAREGIVLIEITRGSP